MTKIIEVKKCAPLKCPYYHLVLAEAHAVCDKDRHREIDPVALRGAFPAWCPLEDKPVEKLGDVEQHF